MLLITYVGITGYGKYTTLTCGMPLLHFKDDYTEYPKVMAKHSVDVHLVSLILFMQFSTCKFGIYGNKLAHIAIIHPLT